MNIDRTASVAIMLVLFLPQALFSEVKKEDLWKPDWATRIHYLDLNEEQRAFALEYYRKHVQYAVKEEGESFDKLNLNKLGRAHGYEWGIKSVTAGLIGFKYLDYQDIGNAVKYFYKDWLAMEKDEKEAFQRGRRLWPGGPGDYNPLAQVIGVLEENGRYEETLRYYPLYFKDELSRFPGKTDEERAQNLIQEYKKHAGKAESYSPDMAVGWEEAIKKVKTGKYKLKPIEPAVRIHRSYHSGDRAETLQALDFYYKRRIRFMLKKASRHKDRKVKRRARELLKKLDKNSK